MQVVINNDLFSLRDLSIACFKHRCQKNSFKTCNITTAELNLFDPVLNPEAEIIKLVNATEILQIIKLHQAAF